MCKLRYTLVFLMGIFVGLFIAATVAAARMDNALIDLARQEEKEIRYKIEDLKDFYNEYAINLEKDRQINEMIRARVINLKVEKLLKKTEN